MLPVAGPSRGGFIAFIRRHPTVAIGGALLLLIVVVSIAGAVACDRRPDLDRSGPAPARSVGRSLVRHRPLRARSLQPGALRRTHLAHRRALRRSAFHRHRTGDRTGQRLPAGGGRRGDADHGRHDGDSGDHAGHRADRAVQGEHRHRDRRRYASRNPARRTPGSEHRAHHSRATVYRGGDRGRHRACRASSCGICCPTHCRR